MKTMLATILLLSALGAPAAYPQEAPDDSLLVEEIVAAESAVDSLRAQVRRLDREIQGLKQDMSDDGGLDRLLATLTGEGVAGDEPEDTRSRRQRVDALLRAITQRPGQLRFNGGATMIVQDLVAGEETSAAGTGSLDLYAHTSFGPGTLLFFAFEAGGGAGVDGLLPLTSPLNGDAVSTRDAQGFDQLVMNEAWAEFAALENAVTLTVGKIDLTNYFDINSAANDETAQFLSGAFVNSAALLAPAPGPGLRARTVMFRRFSLQLGLVSADSTGGTRFRDTFVAGSMGLRLFPDSSHDGNLRAYVYAPPHTGEGLGWGVSWDQNVGGPFVLFARGGRNDAELAQHGDVESAWSSGLQWSGRLRGRALTVAGAWGRAHEFTGAAEHNLELYASWQLNTWTFVSTHLQVAGNEARQPQDTAAIGFRAQFNF